MKVFVVKDYDALSRKTAEIVVDQIRRKPDTIFCCRQEVHRLACIRYLWICISSMKWILAG